MPNMVLIKKNKVEVLTLPNIKMDKAFDSEPAALYYLAIPALSSQYPAGMYKDMTYTFILI